MAIYEYYCLECNKNTEIINRMGDFSSPKCCGRGMMKIMSLPQPAIITITNRHMLVNSLNNDEKAYEFPGKGKHDKRYKAAIKKSLTREKEVIGRGF